MTEQQKKQIIVLRKQFFGYKAIAEKLNLSVNTVKSFCRRNALTVSTPVTTASSTNTCKCCGTSISQTPKRKLKLFCSNKCRNTWWNSHLELVERKANYDYVCSFCHKSFTAYGNSHRKYCSHSCYVADRF